MDPVRFFVRKIMNSTYDFLILALFCRHIRLPVPYDIIRLHKCILVIEIASPVWVPFCISFACRSGQRVLYAEKTKLHGLWMGGGPRNPQEFCSIWWRHQMETFSAVLAIGDRWIPHPKASDAKLWCFLAITLLAWKQSRITGHFYGNPPVAVRFPSQRAMNMGFLLSCLW